MWIALLDYIFIIPFYVTFAFLFALLIDGYLLTPFQKEKEEKKSTGRLVIELWLQFALQGFFAILLCQTLLLIPSPFENILNYSVHTKIGTLVHSPIIINIILFSLSNTLKGRLNILFSRYHPNL